MNHECLRSLRILGGPGHLSEALHMIHTGAISFMFGVSREVRVKSPASQHPLHPSLAEELFHSIYGGSLASHGQRLSEDRGQQLHGQNEEPEAQLPAGDSSRSHHAACSMHIKFDDICCGIWFSRHVFTILIRFFLFEIDVKSLLRVKQLNPAGLVRQAEVLKLRLRGPSACVGHPNPHWALNSLLT